MIVRRGELTDHYVEGDRSVVMVDESVLGLSPIATAILEAVPEGAAVTLEAVSEHIVATFGPPEGPESPEALTEQQLWDLVAHRVLVVVEDDRPARNASPHDDRRRIDSSRSDHERAVTALRDALRHLRSDDAGRWTAPDSLSPRGLMAAARQHHVVPYLAAHLSRLDIPGQARSELGAAASRQHAGADVLAADLSVALEALDNAEVRALAFKGVALAALAYGDFRTRGTGDLDLLVAAEDLTTAHHALTEAGWRPASGYPLPGASWAWRHLKRTGNELVLVGAGSEIDLHWHLMATRGTFPDFDILWERRQIVSVAGRPIPTLSRYDALAHSAGHAAKDRWRWMRSLLDIHHLMSVPETWLPADRPLRMDQLLGIGLSASEFGLPRRVPPVVATAMRQLDVSLVARVHQQQVETASAHRNMAVPGRNLMYRLRGIRLTGGSLAEAERLLSKSALPPWVTAEETSPHAVVAAPRALAKRTLGVIHRFARW